MISLGFIGASPEVKTVNTRSGTNLADRESEGECAPFDAEEKLYT